MASAGLIRSLRRRRKLLLLLGLTALLGCAGPSKTETGYNYRPLNSSELERRAFYLDTYSLEAIQARSQNPAELHTRTPGQ